MKILAIEKELSGATPDQYANLAEAEARRVWELIEEDLIREIYFRADCDSAVILLECADIKHAQQILESLPMVKTELIDFDLIPLKPYPGLSRLFAE